ncbi:MAG: sulfotransferase domain-containing protein, partial [Planctomycetota bacterium]
FLFIGPPKTGSTWLYEVLAQHPDVMLPTLKDLYFFDRHYERGLAWYAKHFDGSEQASAVGEISHDYLYSKEACWRIANDLPNVKLITLLRDPTDRAISHYKYSRRFGNVSGSFLESIEQNPAILERGLYGKYLTPFFEQFTPDQLGVFFFDELRSDAGQLGRRILEFLGLEPCEKIEFDRRVNGQAVSRSVLLSRVARQGVHLVRRLGWTTLLGRAKNSATVRRLFFREATQADSTEFDLSGAKETCGSYYAEDLTQLSVFLRDSTWVRGQLPSWLKGETSVL